MLRNIYTRMSDFGYLPEFNRIKHQNMNPKIISEKRLEKRLTEAIKKRGGVALKWHSSAYTGLPDRLLILPNGTHIWVELKTTGLRPRPTQISAIEMLRRLGAAVYIVDSLETETDLLTDIDNQLNQ